MQLDQKLNELREEAAANEAKAKPISGHQSRTNRGAKQLALECPNERVRNRIADFYRIYGEHTGVCQSAFLVNLMLDSSDRFRCKERWRLETSRR